MKRYFTLQWKRLAKLLPTVAVVGLLLLAGLAAVVTTFAKYSENSADNQRLRVAMSGDTDDTFFQLVMTAFTTMDNSRYTLDMVIMDEEEARRELIGMQDILEELHSALKIDYLKEKIAELEKQKDLLSLAPGATYQNNWNVTIE